MAPPAGSSARLEARVAGLLYLVIFLASAFSEFLVRGRLIVHGDAAATATRILAHEPLYRLGIAAQCVTLLCDAAVALLFYDLFRPVSRGVARYAAAFRLLFVAVMAADLMNALAPLVLLSGASFLSAFSTGQLQALALASQSLYGLGYALGLVFFAVHCVLVGTLIVRSTFLPRVLGGMMAIAGLGYLTNSFAIVLAPAAAGPLFPYLVLPGAVAELSLTLWLLGMGVNASHWQRQSDVAGGHLR